MRAAPALRAAAAIGVTAVATAATCGAVLLAGAYRDDRRAVRPATRFRPGCSRAIGVFGAEALPDRPTAELRARLDHAVGLWRAGVAPVIVVTGGIDDRVDEVVVMRDYVVAAGVPVDRVIEGVPRGNTRASVQAFRGSAPPGPGPVVAVSTSYHALRILAEARRQRLPVIVSSPPDSPERRDPRLFRTRMIAEVGGVVWYALPGWMTRRVSTSGGSWRHTLPLRLAGRRPSAAGARRSSAVRPDTTTG